MRSANGSRCPRSSGNRCLNLTAKRYSYDVSQTQIRIVAIARSFTTISDTPDLVQEILLQLSRSRGFPRAGLDRHLDFPHRLERCTDVETIEPAATAVVARQGVIDPALLLANPSDGDEPARALREFLPTLGEIDRAVLLLYLDNLSHQQMAEILGISENAISCDCTGSAALRVTPRQRLNHAIRSIARCLESRARTGAGEVDVEMLTRLVENLTATSRGRSPRRDLAETGGSPWP